MEIFFFICPFETYLKTCNELVFIGNFGRVGEMKCCMEWQVFQLLCLFPFSLLNVRYVEIAWTSINCTGGRVNYLVSKFRCCELDAFPYEGHCRKTG